MILTCPQCETQFELGAELLQPDGKRVRCTSCSHDWFQLPDPEGSGEQEEQEDLSENAAVDEGGWPEDVQNEEQNKEQNKEEAPSADIDIPEGVKPMQESAAQPQDQSVEAEGGLKGIAKIKAHMLETKNLIGYGAAFVLFVVVLMMLGVLSKPITKSWPAMKGFYNIIGVHVPAMGEGLSFEAVGATYTSDGTVKIVGDVLNLTAHEAALPQLKASMIVEGEALPIEWGIEPPSATIEAKGKAHFKSTYEYRGEHRPKSVTVSFDVTGKSMSVEKVAVENNAAHH